MSNSYRCGLTRRDGIRVMTLFPESELGPGRHCTMQCSRSQWAGELCWLRSATSGPFN